MGYQVGVTPLQMVAAVSALANGGEYVEPRVLRAVYQERPALRVAAEGRCGARSRADTAATLTASWRGVVERGTAKRAQIPGYTVAGKTGHRGEAGQRPLLDVRLQRVVRRLRAVAQPGRRHHRGHRFAARVTATTGGVVAAPIFKRIAEATLRYLGVGPTHQPGAAGARRAATADRPDAAAVRTPEPS